MERAMPEVSWAGWMEVPQGLEVVETAVAAAAAVVPAAMVVVWEGARIGSGSSTPSVLCPPASPPP